MPLVETEAHVAFVAELIALVVAAQTVMDVVIDNPIVNKSSFPVFTLSRPDTGPRDLQTRVVGNALGDVRLARNEHVDRERGHDARAIDVSQAFGPDRPVGWDIGRDAIVDKA